MSKNLYPFSPNGKPFDEPSHSLSSLTIPDEDFHNGPGGPDLLIISDPPLHDLSTPEFWRLYRLAFYFNVSLSIPVPPGLKRGKWKMESKPPEKIRILLVEDYAPFRLALSSLLETRHPEFTVESVSTFTEALAFCREAGPVTCILLDLCLGDMATERTIESMQKLAEHAPVIVLTARGEEESLALDCIAHGADNLMLKGDIDKIGSALLVKKIHYAMARRERDRRIEKEKEILSRTLGEIGSLLEKAEAGTNQETTRHQTNGKE